MLIQPSLTVRVKVNFDVVACRWVEDGNIWTSAGVSAGIDMALHFVLKRFGKEAAEDLAAHMEYDGSFIDGSIDHWGAKI